MNDSELDEMLNQWKAPEPGAELRERIRGTQPGRQRRFSWPSWHMSKGLFAGVAAGAVMCLFGMGIAFPQVFAPAGVRFNLISESGAYNDDGSFTVQEERVSTAVHGKEIILKRQIPDNEFMSLHMRFFDMIHRWLGMDQSGPASITSDCAVAGAAVAGHETLLGHPTTVLQYSADPQDQSRYREWRAPDLDCIVMKWVVQKPAASGGFRITSERRPLAVRMNPAQ
ncbi:MAG TPA: hypothetical protein VHC90_15650 [Bryobacteraceae bacterium]|nr:hypothetical protein [Bryobacteraceae bacterium]